MANYKNDKLMILFNAEIPLHYYQILEMQQFDLNEGKYNYKITVYVLV